MLVTKKKIQWNVGSIMAMSLRFFIVAHLTTQFYLYFNVSSSAHAPKTEQLPERTFSENNYQPIGLKGVEIHYAINLDVLSVYDYITSLDIDTPLAVNASQHVHPWLATCVSLAFLFFIIFVIIMYGG